LHDQDVKASLLEVDQMIQEGKDPGRFVFDLIYYLRDLLLYQTAPSLENVLERAIVDDHFQELAQSLDANWIQLVIKELNKCQQEIKWTNSPKVFIEVAVIKICNNGSMDNEKAASLPAVEELTKKIQNLEQQLQQIKSQPITNNETQPST